MLAPAEVKPHPVHHRYRCEGVAVLPNGRALWLGSRPVASARLALRWLRGRARAVADQLHPLAARPVLGWLVDQAEHERALATLADGFGYELPIRDGDGTRFILTVWPGRSPPPRRP